jgi:hypothetical protein
VHDAELREILPSRASHPTDQTGIRKTYETR